MLWIAIALQVVEQPLCVKASVAQIICNENFKNKTKCQSITVYKADYKKPVMLSGK